MNGETITRLLFAAPAPVRAHADFCLQAGILVFTVAALWLVGSPGPLVKWGYLAGLLGQPFYLVATWRARQWGMFLAAFFVTGLWVRGVVNYF